MKQKEQHASLEVEKYFYNFLFAKSAIAQKTEAVAQNGKLKIIAERRKAAGIGSEADVMEFDLRDANLRADLVLLEHSVVDARMGLKKLLGETAASFFVPVGELQHQHVTGELSHYVDRIKASNPVLLTSTKELEIAEIQSKRWRSLWLPKIDLEARGGYFELDARPEDRGRAVSVLLLAKLDLFSGNVASWERREGAAKKLKAEESLGATLVNTLNDVERSFQRLKILEKSVDLKAENEVRAKKYYDTVLREYNAGIKNSVDVKVAADMLAETSHWQLRYKYDFLCDRIELERLLGFNVAVETIKDPSSNIEKVNTNAK